MAYYVELANGRRLPCDEWQYMLFTKVHGYMHIIRDLKVTIIRKGN